MRVRCTRGMRIPNFYGNFSIRGQDLLALPNVTSDTCMGFDLVHDEPMLNTSVVCIQSALLYTSQEGERRIRVHTHALQVTSVLSDVINSVDTDAVCNLLAKQALDLSLKSGLDTARMRLQQACIDIIKSAKGGGRSVGVYGANAHYPSQKKLHQDTSQQVRPSEGWSKGWNVAAANASCRLPTQLTTCPLVASLLTLIVGDPGEPCSAAALHNGAPEEHRVQGRSRRPPRREGEPHGHPSRHVDIREQALHLPEDVLCTRHGREGRDGTRRGRGRGGGLRDEQHPAPRGRRSIRGEP